MDELGFNKIAGAVLATALGIIVLRSAPHKFMHTDMPETPAYSVGPIAEEAPGEVVELPFPQPEWIAAMDATRGAKVFKKCTSCHKAESGGANGTGPNLWNVVGAPAGTHAGFKYSNAFTSSGKTWTYEELDGFLEKPSKYISGTKMSFIGLKKETDRAAVIEFLRLASDAPIAQPMAAVTEAAPAEDVVVIEKPAGDPTEAQVEAPAAEEKTEEHSSGGH